jgi:sulfur transfer protein SufE
VGRGIVHEGYIYGIMDNSPLEAALEKITDKKKRYKFILEHGEKRGKVDFDTRRQRMEEVAGLGRRLSRNKRGML